MTTPLEPWLDPAVEARVVAAVLGEASVFEQAEIDRLLAEYPELSAFARRIKAVHGLLGENFTRQDTDWKLPDEKRARVLAAIGPVTAVPPVPARAALQATAKRRMSVRLSRRAVALTAIAAAVLVGCWVALDSILPRARSLTQPFVANELVALRTELPQELHVGTPKDLTGALVFHEAKRREVLGGSAAPGSLSADSFAPAAEPAAPSGSTAGKSGPNLTSDTGGMMEPVEGSSSTAAEPSPPTFATIAPPPPPSLPPAWKNVRPNSGLVAAAGERAKTDAEPQSEISVIRESTRDVDPFASPESPDVAVAAGTVTSSRSSNFPVTPATPADFDSALDGAKFPAEYEPPLITGKAIDIRQRNTEDLGVGWALGNEIVNSVSEEEGKLGADRSDLLRSVAQSGETNGRASVIDGKEQGESGVAGAKGKPVARPAKPAPAPTLESGDTASDPVSTFSLNVSDASFLLGAQALLGNGSLPEPGGVRTEDYVNAMDYGDALPARGEAVAAVVQQAAHPFLPGRNLVRVGVRTAATGRADAQPLCLTILMDQSGSMERPDRAQSVQRAIRELAGLLKPQDTVTMIGFARTPRLLADRLTGDRLAALPEVARQAVPDGGTNIDLALELAAQSALRQYNPAAQNRVLLITDGAANLGTIDPEAMTRRVEAMRRQRLAFDACGVGTGGLDDTMLEALTRKGDGRYLVLGEDDDNRSLATELAGAFRPAARNVKIQVRFNPDRVGRFHLMGFEKHLLQEKDFRDDTVDAAELAAAEQGNALYQIELKPNGIGEIGDVAVRFQDTATGRMVERHWTIPYDASTPPLEHAMPSMQLAATAGLLAESLKGSPLGELVRLGEMDAILTNLRRHYPGDERVDTLLQMAAKTRSLK